MIRRNLCWLSLQNFVDSGGNPVCGICGDQLLIALREQERAGVVAMLAESPAQPGEHGTSVLIGTLAEMQQLLRDAKQGRRMYTVRPLLPQSRPY